MTSSVRLAAKAHKVALIVLLPAVASAILSAWIPHADSLIGASWSIVGFAVTVALVSAFHIAVSDALQRMKLREKHSEEADDSV